MKSMKTMSMKSMKTMSMKSMMPMRATVALVLLVALSAVCVAVSCQQENKSDKIQQEQQEAMLLEATAQTGMPAITNFRERKLVKDLLELRDQDGLTTYTYLWSAYQTKFVLVGKSIGYGIPYAMQYTNPMKISVQNSHYETLPQADPNGLFSPEAAEGTWIFLVNPKNGKAQPAYFEERVTVLPFPLPADLVAGGGGVGGAGAGGAGDVGTKQAEGSAP